MSGPCRGSPAARQAPSALAGRADCRRPPSAGRNRGRRTRRLRGRGLPRDRALGGAARRMAAP
eukprot:3775381-Pyramimonas_sp.AAC.1